MNKRLAFLPPLALLLVAGLAGCATAAQDDYAMEARYEASLAHWKGAPESQLLASWGKPTVMQDFPDGRVLVYVVRHDIDNGNSPRNYQVPTITAFGAPVISAGMTAAPVVPVTCTTRFMVHEGVVSSWKFDGLGCGAPQ
jgi:hypothetical protein